MYKNTMMILKNELRRIERLIDLTNKNVGPKLPGSLERRPLKRCDSYRVVQRCNGKQIKRRIGNDEVIRYVRNHFAHAHLTILKKNHDVLSEAVRKYQDDSRIAVYNQLSESYRKAGKEGFVDRRYEELKAWAKGPYETNPAPFTERATRACDNRMVRSKGECIWYNELCHAMIPFRYDSMIWVTNDKGQKVKAYPDFLIQCYDGSMIIIEHLGMLEDVGYADRFRNKLRYYLREDYVAGDNFFITSDDIDSKTNSAMILRTLSLVEEQFFRGAENYL